MHKTELWKRLKITKGSKAKKMAESHDVSLVAKCLKVDRSREECLKVESVERGVFKSGIGRERSV